MMIFAIELVLSAKIWMSPCNLFLSNAVVAYLQIHQRRLKAHKMFCFDKFLETETKCSWKRLDDSILEGSTNAVVLLNGQARYFLRL